MSYSNTYNPKRNTGIVVTPRTKWAELVTPIIVYLSINVKYGTTARHNMFCKTKNEDRAAARETQYMIDHRKLSCAARQIIL